MWKNSNVTCPYFDPSRISYNLGRKNILFSICEFCTLKPFNYIYQKFHHGCEKFHKTAKVSYCETFYGLRLQI